MNIIKDFSELKSVMGMLEDTPTDWVIFPHIFKLKYGISFYTNNETYRYSPSLNILQRLNDDSNEFSYVNVEYFTKSHPDIKEK